MATVRRYQLSVGSCRQHLLLALGLAAAFVAVFLSANVADAAPSGLSVGGLDKFTNAMSVTWTDSVNYNGGSYTCRPTGSGWNSTSGFDGARVYYSTSSDAMGGSSNHLGSDQSSCTDTFVSDDDWNFADAGGTYYFKLRTQYRKWDQAEGRYDYLYGSWSNVTSRSIIPRVQVTSATVNEDRTQINVSWTAWSGYASGVDWNYVVDFDRNLSSPYATGRLGTDSPNLRSGTITLSENITPGTNFYVWVLTNGAADRSRSHSRAYETATTQQTYCDNSNLEDLGSLQGYGHDVSGQISATDCIVDYEDEEPEQNNSENDDVVADVFQFRLSETRQATFTLTVITPFATTSDGKYKIRVRSVGLSGDVVGSAQTDSDDDNEIVLGALTIASGFDYIIEVMRTGTGGGYDWSLSLSYGHISPPTPTPAPTPTPRIQPNQDFRLHPNPGGIAYTVDTVYQFEFEGISHVFPVTARSSNPAALELAVSPDVTCDTAAADEVQADSQSIVLYVKACTAGRNTTLSLVGSGGDFLAEYSIFVRGEAVPEPEPATIPQGLGADVTKRDELGLGIVLGVVCGGFGVGCDTDLITNILVTVGAVMVMGLLLKRSRGGATSMSVGVAAAFGVAVLMLGYLWVGFDLWLVVIVLLPILAVGGIAAVNKGRQAG